MIGKSLKTTSSYSLDFNPERKKLDKDISNHEKRARGVLRQAALANSDRLIDREILKEVVIETSHRWTGCMMLPVNILFFLFYSVAASLHEDVAANHLLEAPVRDRLTPPLDQDEEPTALNLQGVNDISDAYEFIEHTFLNLFLAQKDEFNNLLPASERGTVFQYNQLQGLVVLELQRSKKVRCSESVASHLWCYPEDELTDEPFGREFADMVGNQSFYTVQAGPDGIPILNCEKEGFVIGGCDVDARRLAMLRDDLAPKVPQGAPSDVADKFTYKFAFRANATWEHTKARFDYLKERGFLDDQATTLKLKAYYLNYQLQAPRLQTVTVALGFTRGGGLQNTVTFMCLALDTFIHDSSIVFDILFILMLLATIGMLGRDAFKAAIQGGIKAHFTFVNIISWMTVVCGMFIVFLMLGTGSARSEIKRNIISFQENPTEANAYAMANEADVFSSFMAFVHVVIADAHLLFMFRCFISLKWQPRLAVVTRTISKMSSDLMHFLVVLIPTFVAFAIAGMMMFGRRLQDWSTMPSAMATCFKISMENEFKWRELSAVDFFTSALWVVVFVPLVVLLMLNMVLAIIMDVYQEVRREAGNTMTIGRHVHYIYMAITKRIDWVSSDVLYSGVSNMPHTISTLELRQAFPSMPDFQGEYLVEECKNRARYISRCGVDAGVTAGMVAAIHVSLEEMLNDIASMKSRGWMGMGFEIANAAERECVKDILTSVSMQQHWMKLTQKAMGTLQDKIEGVEDELASKPVAACADMLEARVGSDSK